MESGSGTNKNNGKVFSNGEGENVKVGEEVQQRMREMKGILEHNRMMFEEIEQNNEDREAGSTSRHLALMLEIDNNIVRLEELYSYLSISFSLSLDKGFPTGPGADAGGGDADAGSGDADTDDTKEG